MLVGMVAAVALHAETFQRSMTTRRGIYWSHTQQYARKAELLLRPILRLFDWGPGYSHRNLSEAYHVLKDISLSEACCAMKDLGV